MNDLAAERLAQAIEELYLRIHGYCETIAQSQLRVGACTIAPKDHSFPPPSVNVLTELQEQAKQHFCNLGVKIAHLRYFDPPIRSLCKPDDHVHTKDDYQLIYQEVPFDDNARVHTWAQELLYCPDVEEVGVAHNKWFVPQMEAIRLTTQLHDSIVEIQTVENIRKWFCLPWRDVFEPFVRNHIVRDDNLGINTSERKLHQEGVSDWISLYPEIQDILLPDKSSLYDIYKIFRNKWVSTRNDKIKYLLGKFIRYVEHTFIEKTTLNDNLKQHLLASLREHRLIEESKVYPAQRPALCLSYSELYRVMRCIIGDFGASPKKNIILGEMALFIWICQHVAFSPSVAKCKIQDIFRLRVQDVVFNSNELILFGRERVKHSKGLAYLLLAWVGDAAKERPLFHHLNYENFRKRLRSIEEKIGANRFKAQDFLHKAHTINDLRIPIALRNKIDTQMEMIKHSPYKVDNHTIYNGLKKLVNTLQK